LERIAKLAFARLLRLQPPRIFDGDCGLIGEGLKQREICLSLKGLTSVRRMA